MRASFLLLTIIFLSAPLFANSECPACDGLTDYQRARQMYMNASLPFSPKELVGDHQLQCFGDLEHQFMRVWEVDRGRLGSKVVFGIIWNYPHQPTSEEWSKLSRASISRMENSVCEINEEHNQYHLKLPSRHGGWTNFYVRKDEKGFILRIDFRRDVYCFF